MLLRLPINATLAILLVSPVSAETTDDITTIVNGFVYTTIFSDNNWQENVVKAAVNLNMSYKDNYKFSLQSSSDDLISRAAIEYSRPITDHVSVFASYGIIHRLDSFFNNTTDNPGSSGLAILPFSAYNYNLRSTSLTSIHGVEAKTIIMTDNDNLFTIRATIGEMVISDNKPLVVYLTNDASGKISPKKSYDMAIHYETANYHIFATTTKYNMQIDLIPASYEISKIGMKYSWNAAWIQAEISRNSFTQKEKTNSTEYYAIIGADINDKYQTYIGHSYAKSSTNIIAKDTFVGISKENGNYSFSVEYHTGSGSDWMKNREIRPASWSAVVTSITYRFK